MATIESVQASEPQYGLCPDMNGCPEAPKKASLATEMTDELEILSRRLDELHQKVSEKLKPVYLPIVDTSTDNKEPVPKPYPELFDQVRNIIRTCNSDIYSIEKILDKVEL